jgi:basic amino acid/polyamine antiporter, APA family
MTHPPTADAALPGQTTPAQAGPARRFSSVYVAMVAVAMVVGAGIFKSPAEVAGASGDAGWMAAAWLVAGLISLIGALCYAELSTTFPNAGGDYHFLKLAYGRRVAFLFAWARFAVINTGSIALLGFVLGDYLNSALPLPFGGAAVYAALAVVIMTGFNLRGAHKGADTADYGLTSLEVMGLLLMAAAGIWLVVQGAPAAEPAAMAAHPPWNSFGYALVMALLAFGGWTEVATLSAETKDPKRGMVRALVLAIGLITALYLLVNWAFWYGLGITGLAQSATPAADLMARAFGPAAGFLTALAIAFAVITSISATIVVGARTTYACAHDWQGIAALGQWDNRRGIPTAAIWAQGLMGLVLVGFGAAYKGFQTLVDYTAPIYWLFLGLSAAALIILRFKFPAAPRPFRTPLFPLLPVLFLAAAAFMLWSAVNYVTADDWRVGAGVSFFVMASGLVALVFLSLWKPALKIPPAPQ